MNTSTVIGAWTHLARGAIAAGYCSAVAAAWGTSAGVRDVLALGHHALRDDAPLLQPRDRFDLASVTKVLSTATALALAYQHGQVDLDATLGDWPNLDLPPPLRALTVRELVTHTSGLSNRKPDPRLNGKAALANWFDQVPLPAGERSFCYACINAVLAGRVAEACLGKTLDEVLAFTVTHPLALHGMGFGPRADEDHIVPTKSSQRPGQIADEPACAIGRPLGNAGVFASVLDVATVAAALLATWHERSTPIGLTTPAVRWMWQPVRNAAGVDYAVLWDRHSPKSTHHRPCGASPDAVGHSGWVGHSLWIDPPGDCFVVIMTNRSSMPGMLGRGQQGFIDASNRWRGVMGDAVGVGRCC